MSQVRVAHPIERIAPPSIAAFRRNRRPAVIEGAIDRWPALAKWTNDDLVDRFGDIEVPTFAMVGNNVAFDRRGLLPGQMTVRDFVQSFSEGRARVRCPLPGPLPALFAEVEVPRYCGRLALRTHLWWSPASTISPLHFDVPDNLLAQVVGTKRVLLFAPRDTPYLAPEPPWSSRPQFSRLDLSSNRIGHAPFERARPFEAWLRRGDLLFIPSGWWHYTESEDVTISVGFWWSRARTYPLILGIDLAKRLRGLTR